MQLKRVEPLNNSDLEKYRQLKSVLSQGDFNLKGNAVQKVAALFIWYDSLESKLHDAIGRIKKAGAPKIKKIRDADNSG